MMIGYDSVGIEIFMVIPGLDFCLNLFVLFTCAFSWTCSVSSREDCRTIIRFRPWGNGSDKIITQSDDEDNNSSMDDSESMSISTFNQKKWKEGWQIDTLRSCIINQERGSTILNFFNKGSYAKLGT